MLEGGHGAHRRRPRGRGGGRISTFDTVAFNSLSHTEIDALNVFLPRPLNLRSAASEAWSRSVPICPSGERARGLGAPPWCTIMRDKAAAPRPLYNTLIHDVP